VFIYEVENMLKFTWPWQ